MFFVHFDQICKRKGTTPSAVVKSLGLSTSKITAWKNGSIPKQEILTLLAEHLDVNVSEFFSNWNATDDAQQKKEPISAKRAADILHEQLAGTPFETLTAEEAKVLVAFLLDNTKTLSRLSGKE